MTSHHLLRICLTGLLTMAIPGAALAGPHRDPLGNDTPAIYRDGPNRFYLTDDFNTTPAAVEQQPKWKPGGATYTGLGGDWDASGTDTVGAYNPAVGTFHLKSNNVDGDNTSEPNFRFRLANPPIGEVLTCDTDGMSGDSIAIYNDASGKFFIRDTLTSGAVDTQVKFKVTSTAGLTDIIPLCGDWNNNGTDTFGLYNKATGKFFLTNDNAVFPLLPAVAEQFVFRVTNVAGLVDILPFAGDYNGDGMDTVGLYNTATGRFFGLDSHNPADGVMHDVRFRVTNPASGQHLMGNWDVVP